MLVDSHCHLDFDDFNEDGVEKIVKDANDLGVGHMVTINTQIAKFSNILNIANEFDCVECTVGTHPCHASEEFETKVTLDELVELASKDRVIGIGETGLDYYYETDTKEVQIASFQKHIDACIKLDMPIIIHSRAADEDMIRILQENKGLRGVLHCFSSSRELAIEALKLGFYISASGIITFKNAQELRDIMAEVPLDRLLVETDSPYLAPMPNRGKRNEPAFVTHTALALAKLKNVTEEEIAEITTENFYRLFNKSKGKRS